MSANSITKFVEDFLTSNNVDDSVIEAWNDKTTTKKVGNMIKGKKPKDKDAPKKSKSAYIYFCTENRAAVKEELGEDAKNTEITCRLGELWNELKNNPDRADELAEYAKMAGEDKERYDNQKAEYKPTNKPEKTPRAKSAYIFFCMEKRKEAMNELGDDAKNTEITTKLAEMWNSFKEDPDNEDELERLRSKADEDKMVVSGEKVSKKVAKEPKKKEPKEPKVKEPKAPKVKEPKTKAPKVKEPKEELSNEESSSKKIPKKSKKEETVTEKKPRVSKKKSVPVAKRGATISESNEDSD